MSEIPFRLLRRLAQLCLLVAVALSASCIRYAAVRPASHLAYVDLRTGSASFDDTRPDTVEMRWVEGRSLLAEATLNGHDVGSFVVDTGATGMVVTADAARAAGLVPVGRAPLQARRDTTVFEADAFRIGPLTMRNARFTAMRMPDSEKMFGAPVAGFCGYDVFESAVVTFDVGAGTLALRDPGSAAPDDPAGPDDAWEPLVIEHRLPHVHGSFEGGAGLFLVDAGFTNSVWLFDDALDTDAVLERHRGRRGTVLNFGGSTSVVHSRLDAFELAGCRVENVPVLVSARPKVLRGRADAAVGMIGMELLARVRMTLDYRQRRVRVTPPSTPSPGSPRRR